MGKPGIGGKNSGWVEWENKIVEGVRVQWEGISLQRKGLKMQEEGLAKVEAAVTSILLEALDPLLRVQLSTLIAFTHICNGPRDISWINIYINWVHGSGTH